RRIVHAYERIADHLTQRIQRGELRPGQRIPSARQITREWHVALATATRALQTLQHQGLVRSRPGSGTVVADAAPAPPPAPRPSRPAYAEEHELSRERIVRAAIAIADLEGLDALSMRRLATALSTATMSVYRHVE